MAVATQEIERTYLAPGCERIPVDEDGITGTYFKPAAPGPRPAVIVMHGTSNRIMEDRGALLASRGYAVLSLLYFGGKGQPDEYIGIPVEYFEKSIAWLTVRPEVREGGVALIGVSRGGEGALLVASKLEQVSAVVSISGGGVIFEGLHKNPREGGPETPWTWRGDPVPFVERKDSLSFTLKAVWSGMSKKPLSTLATYIDGMEDAAALQDATIRVENIKGPVLLVSGGRTGCGLPPSSPASPPRASRTAATLTPASTWTTPGRGPHRLPAVPSDDDRLYPRLLRYGPGVRGQPRGERARQRGILGKGPGFPGGIAAVSRP